MFDTCVLGVDPGIARLGLAVVAGQPRHPHLLWADTVRTPSDQDESERLLVLVDGRARRDRRARARPALRWNGSPSTATR